MSRDKITILFIERSNIFAGAEYCLLSLCQNLNTDIYKIVVLCDYPRQHHYLYTKNNISVKYRNSKIRCWMGSDYSYNALPGSDAVKRIIFALQLGFRLLFSKVDIIHINLLRSTDVLDVLIARFFGVKVVGHVRSLQSQVFLKRLVLNSCDRVIATSEYVLAELEARNLVTRCKRIYDPIDITKYAIGNYDMHKVKDEINVKSGEFVFASIAILDKRKGHETAIKAFSEILRVHSNCKLIIAGGSSDKGNRERQRLEKVVLRLNIKNKVIFTGHVEDVVSIFSITDVVLALSEDGEAFGRVPLEAASARRAVIATRVGATPEIIIDKITGFLVEPKNYLEVSEKMELLINSKELRLNIVEKAFLHLEKNFTALKHVKLVEGVYDEISPQI